MPRPLTLTYFNPSGRHIGSTAVTTNQPEGADAQVLIDEIESMARTHLPTIPSDDLSPVKTVLVTELPQGAAPSLVGVVTLSNPLYV